MEKEKNINLALKEYVRKFDELPFLPTTMTYDNEDYQVLLIQAVNRGKPLTEKEIAYFFHNQYDLVKHGKGFSNFKKN